MGSGAGLRKYSELELVRSIFIGAVSKVILSQGSGATGSGTGVCPSRPGEGPAASCGRT